MGIPDLSSFKYNPKIEQVESKPDESVENHTDTDDPLNYSQKNNNKKRAKNSEHGPGNSISLTKRPKNWSGPLAPLLEPELKVVFVGFNPGIESGRKGHYYAHHSNRFWKFLFWSGITPTMHTPADDTRMPELYRVGFTDLVARCTKGIQELSKEEMAEGAQLLDQRIGEVKPRAVCLVGKGIWESIAKIRQWDKKKFRYGKDPHHKFGNNVSDLYCVPSTSGLNSINVDLQLKAWKELVRDIS